MSELIIKTNVLKMSDILETEIKKILKPFLYTELYYLSNINGDMIYFDIFEDTYALSFAFKIKNISLQKNIYNGIFPWRHITFKDGGWEDIYKTRVNYNYISDIIDLITIYTEDKGFSKKPSFKLTFKLKGEIERYNIKAIKDEETNNILIYDFELVK